jgi:hypothetical protein
MRALAAMVLAMSFAARPAAADVVRYAMLVGENSGEPGEPMLRYAADDARRLRDALAEMGNFLPENIVLLEGGSAEEMRSALIRMNDRIRTAGQPAVLLVFYSGHGDATALHLGATPLPLEQLEALVRGSAAAFRLLIVDACRSGALTRVKGGAGVPAPRVEVGERLPSDGVVFWTSSAENEDAQESDDIRGSFFTHRLVSALLGAADSNGDGTVTLGEAYRYAYEATLRSTSRTLAGVQHATFRHDTHGMTDVALTTLGGHQRATLGIPADRDYLIFQDSAEGAVVAEVGARDGERQVSLRPGRYFLRGRAPDRLLEGSMTLRAGERGVIDEGSLDQVAFARLVRKGMGLRPRANAAQIGYTVRTPLWSGATPCQGVLVAAGLDLPVLTFSARAFGCLGGFRNEFLRASSNEFGAELAALHDWDVRGVTFGLGAIAGASFLVQRFTAPGAAPSRTSPAAHLGLASVIAIDLTASTYLEVEVDGLTNFFPEQSGDQTVARAVFSARGNLMLGRRW